jgi:DNA-binding MarR family transcriptional regulator
MHQLPFAFKRAHHATLKLLDPIAARNGLTPARFDLLYVLHAKIGWGGPYQFHIAELLGVCRSTVCKMVRAMEKIGLVERRREILFDGRRRRVIITPKGRCCIGRVLKAIRRREIEKPLLDSVAFWNRETRNKRFDFVVDLGNHVRHLLHGLGDRAERRPYPTPLRTEFQKHAALAEAAARAAPESDGYAADHDSLDPGVAQRM